MKQGARTTCGVTNPRTWVPLATLNTREASLSAGSGITRKALKSFLLVRPLAAGLSPISCMKSAALMVSMPMRISIADLQQYRAAVQGTISIRSVHGEQKPTGWPHIQIEGAYQEGHDNSSVELEARVVARLLLVHSSAGAAWQVCVFGNKTGVEHANRQLSFVFEQAQARLMTSVDVAACTVLPT